MREFKFRFWDPDTKKYEEQEDFEGGTDVNDMFVLFWRCGITVEQYTGLKDTNGKEIYEGDIIQHFAFPKGDTFVVEWNTKNGCWDGYGCFSEWHQCTVVGNIHD
jgi:uncharacterized phage protein (TIGR01671 family)